LSRPLSVGVAGLDPTKDRGTREVVCVRARAGDGHAAVKCSCDGGCVGRSLEKNGDESPNQFRAATACDRRGKGTDNPHQCVRQKGRSFGAAGSNSAGDWAHRVERGPSGKRCVSGIGDISAASQSSGIASEYCLRRTLAMAVPSSILWRPGESGSSCRAF